VIALGKTIAQHRKYPIISGTTILAAHVPPQSQIHLSWLKQRFIQDAIQLGPNITQVIKHHLNLVKVEAQGYKTAASI
jgi:hypothetical protein